MKFFLTPLFFAAMLVATFLVPGTVFARYNPNIPWYQNVSLQSTQQAVANLSNQRVHFLPIPILYGVELEDFSANFGVPRSGGRSHEGQDILALTGTPIVSPTRAVVTHIHTGPSAGLSVYTANPGGETFAYLHLDRYPTGLEEGDVLEVGDLIGYVGNSGNASGGAAHLHFEILQDQATDPYPRITKEFTLQEKMQFTEKFLSAMPEEEAQKLATFLSVHFAEEFAQARAQNIPLPALISNPNLPQAIPDTDEELAAGLTIGSRGTAVVALQKKLIAILIGPKAIELEKVGPTGYYGPLTQAALEEYETYLSGPIPVATVSPQQPTQINKQEPIEPPEKSFVSLTTIPQVNLTNGHTNDAVIWLQNYLIQKQSGPQALKLQEVGATGYFGALTQAALAEYQVQSNISPAVGYYGPVTREYIQKTN